MPDKEVGTIAIANSIGVRANPTELVLPLGKVIGVNISVLVKVARGATLDQTQELVCFYIA